MHMTVSKSQLPVWYLRNVLINLFSGKIKIWDLKAALDPRIPTSQLCIKTLNKHTGRVFRLQFDEFQIIRYVTHDECEF